MANDSHQAKLIEGPALWNAWRRQNPLVAPQLDAVALTLGQRQFGVLQGGPIDLARARLASANLRHATLTGADLGESVLVEADLTNAKLDRTDLRGADLSSAVFDGADLARARLDGAIVSGARLAGAKNLTQEQLDRSYGDEGTTIPPGLVRPARWARNDIPSNEPRGRRSEEKPVPAPDDVYAALGLTRRASPRQIRQAYRELAKAYHPDLNPGDRHAEDWFKAVSRAASVLRDPVKRKRLDEGEIDIEGKPTRIGVVRQEVSQKYRLFFLYFAAPVAVSFLLLAAVRLALVSNEFHPKPNRDAGASTFETAVTRERTEDRLETASFGEAADRQASRDSQANVNARSALRRLAIAAQARIPLRAVDESAEAPRVSSPPPIADHAAAAAPVASTAAAPWPLSSSPPVKIARVEQSPWLRTFDAKLDAAGTELPAVTVEQPAIEGGVKRSRGEKAERQQRGVAGDSDDRKSRVLSWRNGSVVRAARVAKARQTEPSPHAFARQPCKLTPACQRNEEMCGC